MSDLYPEKYRHDLEVVQNTAKQVIGDFDLVGIEIHFSGNTQTAYAELLEQVTPALINLYKKNQVAFNALLYRIDVDEKKYRTLQKNSQGELFYHQLAELVIEREFIKVLTRKLFSSQNG